MEPLTALDEALGAWRKGADLLRARQWLNRRFGKEDWDEAFDALMSAAQKGNVRAAELLMRYAFGLPSQAIDAEEELPLIQMVEVVKEK